MANKYRERPSKLIDLQDPYEAFCFDEACFFITRKIEEGETPVFEKKLSSFRDLYKNLPGGEMLC